MAEPAMEKLIELLRSAEAERDRYKAALEAVCWDKWDTQAGKRGTCRVCGAMTNESHYPDAPCFTLNPKSVQPDEKK